MYSHRVRSMEGRMHADLTPYLVVFGRPSAQERTKTMHIYDIWQIVNIIVLPNNRPYKTQAHTKEQRKRTQDTVPIHKYIS